MNFLIRQFQRTLMQPTSFFLALNQQKQNVMFIQIEMFSQMLYTSL